MQDGHGWDQARDIPQQLRQDEGVRRGIFLSRVVHFADEREALPVLGPCSRPAFSVFDLSSVHPLSCEVLFSTCVLKVWSPGVSRDAKNESFQSNTHQSPVFFFLLPLFFFLFLSSCCIPFSCCLVLSYWSSSSMSCISSPSRWRWDRWKGKGGGGGAHASSRTLISSVLHSL